MAIASGQFTITDFNDINIATTPPASPVTNQLWLDSSVVPNQLKRYDGSSWVIVNEVRVGGRNLALNSAWKDNTTNWGLGVNVTRDTTALYNGYISLKSAQSGLTSNAWRGFESTNNIPAQQGDIFTASMVTKSDNIAGFDAGASMEIRYYNSSGARITQSATNIKPSADNTWQTFTLTGTCPAGTVRVSIVGYVVKNGTLWLAQPKLESGNKATAYTEAPEDVQNQIDDTNNDVSALTTRVSSAEQKITPTAIVSTVRTSTEYTNDQGLKVNKATVISEINQTSESIKISANKIDINGAVTFSSLDTSMKNAISQQGQITKNPIFADWTSTFPAGYSTWGTGAITKESTLTRNGGFGARFNVATLGNQVGMAMGSSAYVSNVANSKYLFLEVDFMLVSGSLDGACILIDWSGMASCRSQTNLDTEVPSPTLGKWHTIRKVIQRPSDTLTGWTGMSGYVLANWSSSGNAVKDIIFDRVAVREATQQEIDLYTNQSGWSSTKSTVDSKASGWDSTKSTVDTKTTNWDDAKSKVDLWKHATDTTKIDGGEIYTNSITANQIATGTITIGKLDSGTQTMVNNGDTAYDGTAQYRTTGVPTNNPTPTGITITSNSNATINIRLDWGQYTQGTKKADFIILFWRKDSTAPTINDSSISFNVNTTGASYYVFEGVNPADTYSFGIASARKTENGLEIGTIQCPTTSPDWLGVTSGTPNFTGNLNGTSASTVVTNANNGNTANTTVNSNKATWDRATNINSDGTFNTSKLSGTVADSQIASATNWNGAKDLVNSWKSGTTLINGGMIATNTVFAQQIAIGDFTNLSQINEEKNPNGNTVITVNNLAYFKVGNGAYASLVMLDNTYVEFKVNDEYYIAWNGYRDSGVTSLTAILRYTYSDGTWNNAGSVTMYPTTSDTRISANLKVTTAPTSGKTVSYVRLFLEKDGTAGSGYYYVRDIEIRKRYAGELIVDGAISASKIASNTITTDKVASNFGSSLDISSNTSITSKVSTSQFSSMITQNADSVKVAFGTTPSTNIIHNGRGLFGTDNWRNNGLTNLWTKGNSTFDTYNPFPGKTGFGINKNTAGEGFMESDSVKVIPNKTYTFSGKFCRESGVSSFDVFIIGSASDNRAYDWTPCLIATNTGNGIQTLTGSFTIPSNINYIYLRVDHNGGTSGSLTLWATDLQIVEGDKVGEWTPHAGEIFNDTTEITGTGVKIKHSNGSYSQMNSSGFYRYQSGSQKDYHYLFASGSMVSPGTSPAFWVNLPSEFANKNFEIGLAVKSTLENPSYYNSMWMADLRLFVYSKDPANARFSVVAYWVNSNGSVYDDKELEFTWFAFA